MSDSLKPHGLYPTRSSVHGIFQARMLEWVAIPFSRESSRPRDPTPVSCNSCIARQILCACMCMYIYTHTFVNIYASAAKLLQSCPTLCDPIDSSPPGSPVPGIPLPVLGLQARTLEWVAISFSNA